MIQTVLTETKFKEDTRQNPWLYMAVTLLLVFIMAARTPLDSDAWWHLRAGEWMVQNGRVLIEDMFSFTRFGEQWINHSWLAEIIFFEFFKIGGSFGLSLLTAILAVLCMGLVFLTSRGSALYKGFILILMTPVAAVVWSPRPQMFSLVMLAALGLLLQRYRERRTQKIWMLVPLFILWSNLHGGYALGLILIAAVLIGSLVDLFLGFRKETLMKKELFNLGSWSIAAWLCVAVNPNGFAAWLIPFKTVRVSSLQNLISEWASPDFHQVFQWPFIVILLLLVLAIGNSGRRLSGIDFMISAVFTTLALTARRNFGPFAISIAPILAATLSQAAANWTAQINTTRTRTALWDLLVGQKDKPNRLIRVRIWINALLVIALLAVGIGKLYLVNSTNFVREAETRVFPVQAVEWIESHRPVGRLISSYTWGGYLQWNLRDYPVFIDGRTDLYDDEIIQDWLHIVQADPGWEDLTDRWQIDLALLEPNRPAVREMRERGWQVLYEDTRAVLLER